MIKENNGITLVALILTVVIMLILISVGTYEGIETYKESKVKKFVMEMQVLQGKINEFSDDEIKDMDLSEIKTEEQKNIVLSAYTNNELSNNDLSLYYLFTENDILDKLEIEDIKQDIMVNIETREIVSTNGIEYKGKMYYTQYNLPNGQKIINKKSSLLRNVDFKQEVLIDGINAKLIAKDITISNGTLKYKEEKDDYWQEITNYTETSKTYEVEISKSGKYIFILEDNTNLENNIEKNFDEIKLTNRPKTELDLKPYNYSKDSDEWAYVQKNSKNYVWIPRFVHKTENGTTITKFIKGNSNIGTDNTYIDETWNIHNRFIDENGVELTGVWVNIDITNQKGLNMLKLLDSSENILIEI